MADVAETLIVADVLKHLSEIRENETPGNNLIFAAKQIGGCHFLGDDSPALQNRLEGMAAILVGALVEINNRKGKHDG